MLDEGEVLISLDVKSLYTNVPVNESITLAADLVYARNEIPTYTKETFVSLLKLAVQNVNFLCGSAWFSQVDGLAMGSKLAVYLANIWMKQFESIIAGRTPVATARIRTDSLPSSGLSPEREVVRSTSRSDQHPCGRCAANVTRRGYSVQSN